AMLMFLVMSGISQLFLLFPLSRYWSPSGRTTKDVKPTLLAFLLYGVMMLLYSVPTVAVGIVGLVIFPADYVVLFIAVTAIWFLCALYILRRPIMGHVADWFDHWIRHKLKEDLAKESAGDNAEKESAGQDR
ncbi:MAG: ATPase P, partial [Candidatus Methanomethylophilus sp.]|nr:ATPase P [Methanomethylophilus sp.]